MTHVLIFMAAFHYSHNALQVGTQEFSSLQACQQAGQAIAAATKQERFRPFRVAYICVPK